MANVGDEEIDGNQIMAECLREQVIFMFYNGISDKNVLLN